MIKRLRLRFILVTMAVTTLMMCILLGLVMHFTGENLEKQSIALVRNHAIAAKPLPLPNSSMPPKDVTPPNGSPPQNRELCIVLQVDTSGSIQVYNSAGYDLSDKDYLQRLVSETQSFPEQTGVLKEYSLRYYRVNVPDGVCIAYADISMEAETMKNLLHSCLKIGTAGFFLFLGISLLLARWAVKPVETAWNLQREFVADASHELKTPLTVIMTNAELLQSDQIGNCEKENAVSGILMMSRQMRRLVENLLDLARMDQGFAKQHFESIEFSQLTRDTVMGFEALYFERERILSEEIEDGIKIKGSRQHLQQVLDILLDNAQKYSLPHSEVLVTLRSVHSHHCLLSVASIGEPIPEVDLKKIFQRFYRVNPSRSRDGSYGLGLSIAEQVVRDHKGKIWAESQNGINRFFVELPRE